MTGHAHYDTRPQHWRFQTSPHVHTMVWVEVFVAMFVPRVCFKSFLVYVIKLALCKLDDGPVRMPDNYCIICCLNSIVQLT